MTGRYDARLARQPWLAAPSTLRLLAALTAEGTPARFVGGCVRDALADRAVKDIDLATPLPPDAVIARLEAADIGHAPTGLQHGTVTAIVDHRPYEVTTLRRDVETFGRHARVAFTDDWEADAARRDLTINALYGDGEARLWDYFGGVADLEAGRVRFVGQARRRIEEDYLRLLRFFRFHAHYGRGEPDAEGLAAASALAPELARISAERKRDELLKLLAAAEPLGVLRVMESAGVLAQVLPQRRGLAVLERLGPGAPLLRLAALLPPGEASATAAARALRLSNEERRRLAQLLAPAPPWSPLRPLLHRLGAAAVRDRARLAAAEGSLTPAALAEIAAEAATWPAPRLPIAGRDLLALGLPPGPAVGRLLARVEAWWIEQDFRPDREACLEAARRLAAA